MNQRSLVILGALATFGPTTASANQRHYTYTYETAVLPMGAAEFESWTTIRLMREDYFARFDHRLEFELGLVDGFQAALYLKFYQLSKGDPVVSESGLDGISLELKGKLLDPVADPIGLGLYFEVGGAPNSLALEGKVLIEKQIGAANLSLNAVYEVEFERDKSETELHAHEIQFDLGAAWFISPRWSLGLELVSRTKLAKAGTDFEVDYSALSLGPTVAYSSDRFWIAATVLPQIAGLAGTADGSALVLDSRERLEIRLLLGLEI